MEKNRRVMCPDNEELANYLLQKRQELADKPKGIKENTNMTVSKAYNNICNAQHPIKTLKDLSDIKGVGKWILVLLRGYFDGGSGSSEPEELTRKGNKRYLPQKNSVAYALLITLYRETVDGNEFMHKQDLIDATEASGLSRAPIMLEKGKGKPSQFGSSPRDWYSGWTCMSTLIKKGFVVKSSCPAKYMLTPEGKEAARECLMKSKMEDPLENLVDVERLSQPDTQNASVQKLCDLCTEETTEKADFHRKKSIDVPLDCLERCTRMGYSKEQVLSAFVEVSETSKKKEISSLLPAVLCRLREDQVYGQEACDGVRSTRIQLSKDGGDRLNLCTLTLRACSSSRPSSNDLKADMNVLSIPPLSFGEKFEDVYEVILILDDREQFTNQGYLHSDSSPDFVVERKNVNDLRSSIRDNRYRDQKLKLLSLLILMWKASSLSLAGRLVLIKSVLSSLPIFYLSLFKIPSSICQKLNSMMAAFVWGGGNEKKKLHWVGWNKICIPISGGGSGVADLNLTNRALLGKWVWKFANEKHSIWKRFVCTKHNVSCHSMDISKVHSPKDSWIWRGIVNNFTKDDSIGGCLRSQAKLQVGNGISISFWNDVCFDSNGWEWNIKTRRNLCDWEGDQLVELLDLLKDIKLIDSVEDCLLWGDAGEGLFSVKECRKSLSAYKDVSFQWNKCVWLGLVPPRIEAFLWQVSHKKVEVRVELKKMGVPIGDDFLCSLCNSCEEYVQHLFIACQVSWDLWNRVIAFWGILSVLPGDPQSLLSSWSDLRPYSTLWKLIPGAVLWSIWKIRNEIIFEKVKLDRFMLFFTVRFRLAKWFLAKFSNFSTQVDCLIGDPSLADDLSVFKELNTPKVCWTPIDFYKMNVDGAVSRTGMSAGIGGIMRDWNRSELISFSQNVGPNPIILAELKAIKKGIEVFVASVWVSKGRLIVESDSKQAVDWILDQATVPTFLSQFVKDLMSVVSLHDIIVRWIPRSCNCEADKLAKEGIG
ncbi:crossover junction endonuclease MUS81-like isoform X2 [Hibiscus syriacus]|uniref:Crossover junction endonuclease MUS81 n=1 Tax=Hibiscus syriacus TaxID=106335 RepID=A0A6A2YLD1_HIBSY|nr:crossover junction endonuclease MUS81-like isoform X2 [Hibiscus syriacus]